MSGIFKDGDWYENADLVCRQCKTTLYEHHEYDGIFLCFSCGGEFDINAVDEQDTSYMPPVMIARRYDGITINTALEFILEDDNETARVFKNQPEAEMLLVSHGYSLEGVYFVECESGELAAALKTGHISIMDVIEELNYRDRSGNKWNDFLYSYTTAELEKVEESAYTYVDANAAMRVYMAAQELEREHKSTDERTPSDIRRLFFDSDMVELYVAEKQMLDERGETPPSFEDFLITQQEKKFRL